MVMKMAKNESASASGSAYEELRRKRMEENRKRMEELQLPRLSLALKPSPTPPKPSPMKRIKRTEVVEVRRSGRVAKLPAPVYREIFTFEHRVMPKSHKTYSYKRRDLANRVYASDEARAAATYKAEELEISLGTDYPSFVKPMLQSHVTGGFWLGLPNSWCRQYLPKRDDTITLIDEEGDEYPTVYLSRKNGLSGGWRGFSLAHELVDGDALVFQLIRPTAFKVYIVRVNGYEKGDTVEALDAE